MCHLCSYVTRSLNITITQSSVLQHSLENKHGVKQSRTCLLTGEAKYEKPVMSNHEVGPRIYIIKSTKDVLWNYVTFREEYDQLTRKAAARAQRLCHRWTWLLRPRTWLLRPRTWLSRPRTWLPRPKTAKSVLEDPGGQGHVLEDSITVKKLDNNMVMMDSPSLSEV